MAAGAETIGGQIKLIENDGTSCTLDVVPGVHNYFMGSWGDCQNDEYYKYQLKDVKSAVWILFGSEDWGGTCPLSNYTEGWQDRIKTVKSNVNTVELSFKDLGSLNPNPPKIVVPGVIFDYEKDEGGVSHEGKLSCVTTVWCPANVADPCDGTPPK
jgi:hypothetical protein